MNCVVCDKSAVVQCVLCKNAKYCGHACGATFWETQHYAECIGAPVIFSSYQMFVNYVKVVLHDLKAIAALLESQPLARAKFVDWMIDPNIEPSITSAFQASDKQDVIVTFWFIGKRESYKQLRIAMEMFHRSRYRYNIGILENIGVWETNKIADKVALWGWLLFCWHLIQYYEKDLTYYSNTILEAAGRVDVAYLKFLFGKAGFTPDLITPYVIPAYTSQKNRIEALRYLLSLRPPKITRDIALEQIEKSDDDDAQKVWKNYMATLTP